MNNHTLEDIVKDGIRLRCINTGSYHLTLGKIYTVQPIWNSSVGSVTKNGRTVFFEYWIINDLGKQHQIEADLFVDIRLHRQEQLDKIGI